MEPIYRVPLRLALAQGEAVLALTPNPVQFGEVAQSQVATQLVTVRNLGSEAVNGLVASTGSPFAVAASACASIPAGGSCTLPVRFMPDQEGLAVGTLRVGGPTGARAETTLVGNSVPLLTDVELTEEGWYFGKWLLGTTSGTKTLGVKNIGDAAVSVKQAFFDGAASPYRMTHTCGELLPPGASCEVSVAYSPVELGEHVGAFRITRTDGRVRDVWMLGHGVNSLTDEPGAGGGLSVTSEIDFGESPLTAGAAQRSVRVANTSANRITLGASQVSAGADTFAAAPNCPTALEPFSSCSMLVSFAPKELRAYEGELVVAASEPQSQSVVRLRGIGGETVANSQLTAVPNPVDFGATTPNTPVQRTVVLTNSGVDALTVGRAYATNEENFVVLRACDAILQPGESCEVLVEMTGRTRESSTGTLVLANRAGEQLLVVPLTGLVPSPVIAVSPASLTFDSVGVGEPASERSVTVSNNGGLPLRFTGIGAAPDTDFGSSDNCGPELAPGASCEVAVSFSPYLGGLKKGTLTLVSNDAESPVFEIPLSGTGINGVLKFTGPGLAFGNVIVGSRDSRALTLSSMGNGGVRLTDIEMVGQTDAFGSAHNCPDLLRMGASCEVTVEFSPQSVGAFASQLRAGTEIEGYAPTVSSTGTGISEEDPLKVSPETLDFGSLEPGERAQLAVTLTNQSTRALATGATPVEGADAAHFRVAATTCSGFLAPESTCQLTVEALMPEVRPLSAQLSISVENGAFLKKVDLVATGVPHVPEAKLEVTPAVIDFGELDVGESVSRVALIKNLGPDAIGVVEVQASDAQFTVQGGCTRTLQVDETCEATLTYAPAKAGDVAATLNVRDENRKEAGADLIAKAKVPEPLLELDRAAVAFGGTDVFSTSETVLVAVKNVGRAPLVVANATASGEFSAVSGCSQPLEPQEVCTIGVAHEPTTAGSHSGVLSIASNSANLPMATVALTGNGLTGLLVAEPAEVAFDTVRVGESAVKSVQVRNTGPAATTIDKVQLSGPDARAFSVDPACAKLAVGEACPVTVRFTAAVAGRHSATVTVTPVVGQPLLVALSGLGPRATATLTPADLVFADRAVATTSPAQSATLLNTGTGSLRVADIKLLNGQEDFGSSHNCPEELGIGASCLVSVSFTPSVSGSRAGTLTADTTNSDGLLSVRLSGRGLGAKVVATPEALAFGQMLLGETAQRSLTLKNTGAVPLVVSAGGLRNPGPFLNNNTCGDPIEPGETCDVSVNAAPDASGKFVTDLVFDTSAGLVAIPVSVSVPELKVIEASPAGVSISGGQAVVLSGTGFTADALVRVRGQQVSAQVVSDTRIDLVAPAMNEGPADVEVTTAAGRFVSTLPGGLTYLGAPRVTGFQPAAGPVQGGWRTDMTGENFIKGMTVLVDGQAAAEVAVLSATRAFVTVPASQGVKTDPVDVLVRTSIGEVVAPGALRYTAEEGTLVFEGADGNFGNIATGGGVQRTVRLVNKGRFELTVSKLVTTTSATGVFKTAGTNCGTIPFKLPAGASCQVVLEAIGPAAGYAVTGSLEATTVVPLQTVTLPLSLMSVTPDYVLSGLATRVSPVSGAFATVAASTEEGGVISPTSKTVYLLNTLKLAGSKIDAPTLTITGADASQFGILNVNKASSAGAAAAAGTVVAPDGLSASGTVVDAGNGTYPHMAVILKYEPKAKGVHVAQLNINYNNGSRAQLPIYGEADWFAYGKLSAGYVMPVVAPSGDFGKLSFNATAPAGDVLRTYYVLVTSRIGKTLRVNRMRIEGADPGAFTIASFTGQTSADGLSPWTDVSPKNATTTTYLQVQVRFKPTRTGEHSAQLVVDHNGDNAEPLVLPLRGVGANDSKIEVSGGLGIVPIPLVRDVGKGMSTLTAVYLRNTGSIGRVTFKEVMVEGSSAFTINQFGAVNGTSMWAPQTPANNRYAVMNLLGDDKAKVGGGYTDLGVSFKFAPTTLGEHRARITVWHDAPGGYSTFELVGSMKTSEPGISTDSTVGKAVSQADMGRVAFDANGLGRNGSVNKTFYLVNLSLLDPYSVSRLRILGPDADAFLIQNHYGQATGFTPSLDVLTPNMKQPSASTGMSLGLGFTPKHAGAHTAMLEVTHNVPGLEPILIPLTGEGAWDLNAVVTSNATQNPPPAFDGSYGNVGAGMTAPMKSVYIKSTGTVGNLVVTGFKVEGSSSVVVNRAAIVTAAGVWGTTTALNRTYTTPVQQDTFVMDGYVNATTSHPTFGLQVSLGTDQRGPQAATVRVFHNGNAQGYTDIDVSGDVVTSANVEVTGSFPTAAVGPVVPFAATKRGAATATRNVYLKATGLPGRKVTYTGFKVEGSASIDLTYLRLAGNSWVANGSSASLCQDMASISPFAAPASGVREMTFKVSGSAVDSKCVNNVRVDSMPHLQITLSMKTSVVGTHDARITIYHDGNDEGFSVFDVSGEVIQ